MRCSLSNLCPPCSSVCPHWKLVGEAWRVPPLLSVLGPAFGDLSLEQGMLGWLPPEYISYSVFRLHL